MKRYLIIVAGLLFLISTSIEAEIYRWTDEDGNVHFGDIPRNKDAEKLNYDKGLDNEQTEIGTPTRPSVEQLEKLTEELRESRLQREEERRLREEELQRQQHEEECAEKREQVARLQQQINAALERRARETRSSTDRTVDSDTYNKKVEFKKLQQDIKENCK